MLIRFQEQDMIDAACVFLANRYRKRPEDFDVNLRFKQSEGFSANAMSSGGWRAHEEQFYLAEQDLVDGVALYLAEFHNFNPRNLDIDLLFSESEGFGANIITR